MLPGYQAVLWNEMNRSSTAQKSLESRAYDGVVYTYQVHRRFVSDALVEGGSSNFPPRGSR